jgi:hypothetical protein
VNFWPFSSDFCAKWPRFSTKCSFTAGEMLWGHLKVVNSCIGSWFRQITLGSMVLLNKLADISLSILWWDTSESSDEGLVFQINLSFHLFIKRKIKRILNKCLFRPVYGWNTNHFFNQNIVFVLYVDLSFYSINQNLPNFIIFDLGRVYRNRKFCGYVLSIEGFMLRKAAKCFLCASCLRFLSKSRLDVIIFHIKLLYTRNYLVL